MTYRQFILRELVDNYYTHFTATELANIIKPRRYDGKVFIDKTAPIKYTIYLAGSFCGVLNKLLKEGIIYQAKDKGPKGGTRFGIYKYWATGFNLYKIYGKVL